MHYTAATFWLYHRPLGGGTNPLCQQRLAPSLQCNDFPLLYPSPCCLCSLLDPPAFHVNQMHVTGFTPSLSMVQERTLILAPHHCWVGTVLQPWSSFSPKHQHCHSRATDELQHANCPIQDVHQHGPTACQRCSRCLCLFGWWHRLCHRVWRSPSFLRVLQQSGQALLEAKLKEEIPGRQQDTITWLSNFCIIVKSTRSNSRRQTLKIMRLHNPGIFFKSP